MISRSPPHQLRALPPVLYLRARDSGFQWLRLSQELIGHELTSGRVGGAAIAARLADAVFIEAARGYFSEQHGDPGGHLSSLQDPAVAQYEVETGVELLGKFALREYDERLLDLT